MTLPRGWAETNIADVVQPIEAADPGAYPQASFRYIDIGSIDNTTQVIRNPKAMIGAEAPSRARRRVRTGDVLFATVRPYLKNIAQVPAELDGEVTSTGICVLRPAIGIESGYLFRRVVSADFIDAMTLASDGTMYPAIADSDVQAGYIAVPPAAEQRRIVAKLDVLTARLARARAELDRVTVLAANLRSTALADMYRAIVDESGTLSIEHFVETLDQGWSPKCESYPAPDDAWGVLKTTAIQPLAFWPQENKALPAGLAPRSRIEVRPGDILVTRAGPRVRCGITCVVRETRNKLMLADKMYRIRCKPDRALPAYVALMLNAPQSLALIESMKTGISDSGLNLTQEKFLSVPIPNLSIAKQEGVVGWLETVFARAYRLEAEATRARALIDWLEAAILARAFRGELVPQDPNDEPASVLLDRIRTQRAATPKPKRGRRASAVA